MRVRRSRLTGDYVQIPNATARDGRLSHMARGILIEILSRPDGWETTADDMWRESVARHGKASPGRRAFRAAFAELKQHLYLTTCREHLPGGRHGTVLTASDVPYAGTSVPPAETSNSPGHTDVPHAGTSDNSTDVPHAGTSVPPEETRIPAAHTDVPPTDVPHAGTSLKKTGYENERKTSQPARPAALPRTIPDFARPLVDRLTASGVNVRWPFTEAEWFQVHALIKDRGVPAMADHAIRAATRNIVESARYFLPGWKELAPKPEPGPDRRPALRAVGADIAPMPPTRPMSHNATILARARTRLQEQHRDT